MAIFAPEPEGAATEGAAGALVAFDFDGTLTARDSFTRFLLWRSGPWRSLWKGVRLVPAVARYLFARDRGALKSAAFQIWIGPITPDALAATAETFAEAEFDRLMRPDALACWSAHGSAGDQRVIVTASPEIIVAPFARRLGADRLMGTRLQVNSDGRLHGALDGANCRGLEKVARLEGVFGFGVRLAAAYGDTAGDREMLARADHPHLRLFSRKPTRRR